MSSSTTIKRRNATLHPILTQQPATRYFNADEDPSEGVSHFLFLSFSFSISLSKYYIHPIDSKQHCRQSSSPSPINHPLQHPCTLSSPIWAQSLQSTSHRIRDELCKCTHNTTHYFTPSPPPGIPKFTHLKRTRNIIDDIQGLNTTNFPFPTHQKNPPHRENVAHSITYSTVKHSVITAQCSSPSPPPSPSPSPLPSPFSTTPLLPPTV